VNSAASALEVDYDDAYKFCKTWFVSALDENLLIWRARNQNKHGDDLENFKPWVELRTDYCDAVKYSGSIGIDLPDRDQLKSAKRVQMQKYIDKADNIRASSSLLAHITVNGVRLTSEKNPLDYRNNVTFGGSRYKGNFISTLRWGIPPPPPFNNAAHKDRSRTRTRTESRLVPRPSYMTMNGRITH
jgi:hypothetical protein